MTAQRVPKVVFQPQTHRGMQHGVNQLVGVVRPTLGPSPRVVAVENVLRHKSPELLDSAGVISRRLIELPDQAADTGAMLLRHVLWKVHDEVGDGTATAAVLFEAVYNRGLTYLAAGGNAIQLRRYLERGLAEILAELDQQTLPLAGQAQLAHLAESLCFDPPLAQLLGEIFDIVGEHGQVDIRRGHGRALERSYVEGVYWPSGPLSQLMLDAELTMRVDMTSPAILISDLDLEDPRALMQVLEPVMDQQIRSLVIVANKLSDATTGLLLAASRDRSRFRAIAVRTPGQGVTEQSAALADLAALCGGRALLSAAGDSPRGFRLTDLGHARRAWVDSTHLGLIGGKGDARGLRRHLATLRAAHRAASEPLRRSELQARIGRLLGGSATLLLGGNTETELTVREERARKTADLLRAALRDGVLPGGGVALLACRQHLRAALAGCTDLDQQAAYRILLHALEAPIRTIAANAGHEGAAVLAQVERAAPGHGFDARSGEIVDLIAAGIFDVATAQKAALRAAVSGAATMLTIDTVVHKRNPESAGGQP